MKPVDLSSNLIFIWRLIGIVAHVINASGTTFSLLPFLTSHLLFWLHHNSLYLLVSSCRN